MELEAAYRDIRRNCNKVVTEQVEESLAILKLLTPIHGTPGFGWEQLNEQQKQFVRSELAITRYREFQAAIGESRNGIKCIYSPSLADLCQNCFAACVVDEGTKIKGDDTIIGTGVRRLPVDLDGHPDQESFPRPVLSGALRLRWP
jgi:hypothetical protein